MREDTAPWSHCAVMVCRNERGPDGTRPSCGLDRGKALKAYLKAALRAQDGPASHVRVLETSCLDVCPADGVAVAVEPGHRVWVVDPERDRDALVAAVVTHAEALAAAPGRRSLRAAARRALRRD